MDVIRFKQKMQDLADIANHATTCPKLDEDAQSDARWALNIIHGMQDDIRQQEIDHLMDNVYPMTKVGK